MTPGSQDALSDWEALQGGKRLLLAFVKIDRKGSTQEWRDLPQEVVLRRSRDYTAGVEAVARAFNAAPLQWQGDGVLLFLKDQGPELAPVRAVRAAKELWERIRCDLNLSVRIAVHAAWVQWNPDPGKIRHVALDHCGHLEHVTPENAISTTEDVYLVLPDSERRELVPLGIAKRDKMPAFVFPANAAAIRDQDAFELGDDLEIWQAFRAYANCPEVRRLRYVGLRLTKKEPPSLDIQQVFIPPEVEPRPRRSIHPAPSHEETADEEMFREAPWRHSRKLHLRSTSLPFRDMFARNQNIVVLGDPGSGKTTLLRWLAVVAAGGRIAMYHEVGVYERLLPLPVSIGRLAEIRHTLGNTASVPDALAHYFQDRNVGPVEQLTPFLRQRIEMGECLFLLDGLDEVRAERREEVHRWLETFAASAPRNRFVVSSRIAGYHAFDLGRGVEVVLNPFTDDQVRRYLAAFHESYRLWEDGVSDPVSAKEETERLLDALARAPRLQALARNPFLLSAVALIHRAEGTLPRHRVQAYEIIARTLCETWENARRLVMGPESRDIPFEEEAIPILGELAVRMQDEWPTGVAPEPYVLQTLANALQQKRGTPVEKAREAAREFLNRAGEKVQVLLERGPGAWGFLHLTFQEYFAAAGLHASDSFEKVALKHLFNPGWQEVIRLGVGYMALVQKRPGAAARFVEKVFRHRTKGKRAWLTQDLRMHIPLAALFAAEARDALPEALRDEIARELAQWVTQIPSQELAEPYLNEISQTDFREDVARVLIPALESSDWETRRKAAKSLGMTRAGMAAQPLIGLLEDPVRVVWETAVEALARIGSDAAVDSLGELLGHEDATKRAITAIALARLSPKVAVAPLVEAFRHSDYDILKRAAEALAGAKDESAIQPVLRVLDGTDRRSWRYAARALAIIDPQSALQALRRNRDHEDPRARSAVADSLGELGFEEGAEVLLDFLSDGNASVRQSAVHALARLGAEEAVPALLKMLGDAHEEITVRGSVIQALGFLGAIQAISPLLGVLEVERNSNLRIDAVMALGSLRAGQALPSLIRVLCGGEHFLLRGLAADAIGSSGLKAAVDPLAGALLHDSNENVREMAAHALGTLKLRAAIPPLIQALREEKNPSIRATVISALGALQAHDAIEPLRKAVKDPDEEVRASAFEALWSIAQATEARPMRRKNT